MDLQLLIERMDVSTYQSLRDSLERGKWPDGQLLSAEQKALVMEALIRWGINICLRINELVICLSLTAVQRRLTLFR